MKQGKILRDAQYSVFTPYGLLAVLKRLLSKINTGEITISSVWMLCLICCCSLAQLQAPDKILAFIPKYKKHL